MPARVAKAARLSSRRLLMAEMEEAEKAWPQSSSVIAFTLRVETPLHVHLGERGDQGLLGTLVAFEQLG
jgi:hypothetical protein